MPTPPIDRRALLAGGTAMVGASLASPLLAAAPRLAPGGFAADELARIPALLQAYVDDGTVAGIVTLLFRKGQVAQVSAVGFQDLAARIPMRRNQPQPNMGFTSIFEDSIGVA